MSIHPGNDLHRWSDHADYIRIRCRDCGIFAWDWSHGSQAPCPTPLLPPQPQPSERVDDAADGEEG